MDKLLSDIFTDIGWDKLYEEAFVTVGIELSTETSSGERRAKSPFPFSDDNNPSFSVNVVTGLWRDWHAEKVIGIKGGNYVQFIALMEGLQDNQGKPFTDYKQTERELRIKYGLGKPINIEWFQQCQEAMKDPDCPGHRLWLNARKKWTRKAVVELGIGYDADSKRIVFPCYDMGGKLVNVRLYAPSITPKFMWAQPGFSGNFMFPASGRNEDYVILVEGEPDVVTLRSLGYNAISGTMGSGNPVPEQESKWFHNKIIYILMDVDLPGIEGAVHAGTIIGESAKSLIRVDLPEWEDRPSNADISDYVGFLIDNGYSDEQVQRTITELLEKSQIQNAILSQFDIPGKQTPFASALSSQNLKQKIVVDAHVIAKGDDRYSVLTEGDATCPGRGHAFCKGCSMHEQYKGHHRFHIEPRSKLLLDLIQVDTAHRESTIRKSQGIRTQCPDVVIETITAIDVDTALITQTMDDAENIGDDETQADQPRREAYFLSYKGQHLGNALDYRMEGYVYPRPKSQGLVFVIESQRPITSRYDTMSITDETINVLKQFQTNQPYTKMKEVADDIFSAYTLIVNREDLHMMYRTIWYSAISFSFMGRIVDRGWIEALIVGDTRCGKSDTFKKMIKLFGTGELVDCKMQTAPGILGAVETSTLTGGRYVVPGIMPRQDRKGPIGFDEFSASRESRSSMMDHLSSTRAEGKVKIVKAASAEFWARVRSAYMANPGQGKMMRDIGGYGIEVIPYLIEQPEDIARFDIGMIVTQDDVSVDELNQVRYPEPPKYTKEAHRLLLQWVWSRRPDQIIWTPDAEQAVVGLSKQMYDKYDQTIPLVEPADQRMRIARVAVSIAGQCYSCDPSSEIMIVKAEHVYAAGKLFESLYDKPTMGYDKYSKMIRIDRSIVNEGAVEKLLDDRFKHHKVMMAEKLLRMREFSLQEFQVAVPMNSLDVNNTLQTLSANRCIQSAKKSRQKDMFELTPQFVHFLQLYIIVKGQSTNDTREA